MGVCSRLGYFDDPLIRAIDNFNLGRKSKSPLNVANGPDIRMVHPRVFRSYCCLGSASFFLAKART